MSAQNPYAPPKANLNTDPSVADIEGLPVSESWKKKFRAMHKAGGPDLPNLKSLAPEEKKNISVFNILAFLFGPFYYLVKGMWRKAIVLFVLAVIALFILDMVLELLGLGKFSGATRFIAPAVFATLANRDYYSRMVLGDNGWWWSSRRKRA